MTGHVSIAGRAPWLPDESLQTLLAVLSADGEEARIAGGAVRNALIGEDVTDIDIATTNLPDGTIARARAAGFKMVPTGKEHGTITVVAKGRPYEVTTLRHDVETDGRKARVVFGRDWTRDAERRDFTFNALYALADGTVIDLVGGLDDLAERRVRFIGEAEKRIREDFLRILRFFRFFASYGKGRPDAEGLKACARLKEGLARLSAERVWSETRRLLAARDPGRALLWMRQASVLTAILPETERWGIDAVRPLVELEGELGWQPDPLLRLAAMLPPDAARIEALAKRLRLSRAEGVRLDAWARAPEPGTGISEQALGALIYRNGRGAVEDRLRLAMARARIAATDAKAREAVVSASRLLKLSAGWQQPKLPVRGADLAEAGFASGPEMGNVLKRLEDEWIESGFALDRRALMARAAELAAKT